jgi:hypothetical protein
MDESFADPGTTAEVAQDNPTEAPSAPVEQGQGAEQVDHFDEKFDPNTLPPELLPAYKQMQAGLTKKFQSHAEERQAFEQAQQQFAEQQQFLSAITQDPDLLQQIQDYLAGEDNPDSDEFVDPFEAKLAEIEQRQAAIEQREYQQQMQALTEQALTADLEEVTKLNGGQELTQDELEVLGYFVKPDQNGIPRIDIPGWQKQTALLEARQKRWVDGKTAAPSPPPSSGQPGSEKFDITNKESRVRHLAALLQREG